MVRKVLNQADFDSLESSGDTDGLLNVINQERYRLRSAKYAFVAYHLAQVKFYLLRQGQYGYGNTVYDHLEHHSDMVNLTESARGKLDGVPDSIVTTPGMRGLCGFLLQSYDDDKPAEISNYINPTLDEFQAIHKHTHEAYLSVSMLLYGVQPKTSPFSTHHHI